MAIRYRLTRVSIGLAVLAAMIATGAARAQLPEPETVNGIEYVTGGFGADMSKAFRQAESDYPLALTFAASDEGGGARPFVADVRVVVRDASGGVVMEVPSAGPYLLARLEPGSYVVDATYMGKTQTRRVTLKKGATTREVITWPRP